MEEQTDGHRERMYKACETRTGTSHKKIIMRTTDMKVLRTIREMILRDKISNEDTRRDTGAC